MNRTGEQLSAGSRRAFQYQRRVRIGQFAREEQRSPQCRTFGLEIFQRNALMRPSMACLYLQITPDKRVADRTGQLCGMEGHQQKIRRAFGQGGHGHIH